MNPDTEESWISLSLTHNVSVAFSRWTLSQNKRIMEGLGLWFPLTSTHKSILSISCAYTQGVYQDFLRDTARIFLYAFGLQLHNLVSLRHEALRQFQVCLWAFELQVEHVKTKVVTHLSCQANETLLLSLELSDHSGPVNTRLTL